MIATTTDKVSSAERPYESRGSVTLGRTKDGPKEAEEFNVEPSWFTRGCVTVGKSGTSALVDSMTCTEL